MLGPAEPLPQARAVAADSRPSEVHHHQSKVPSVYLSQSGAESCEQHRAKGEVTSKNEESVGPDGLLKKDLITGGKALITLGSY
jgi:hypothetical protein